ncbi:MAG: Trm112 family protein [Euryarchaeota archaeon]|nr:Trm112 family protein [Euryarchaeota archaeon]
MKRRLLTILACPVCKHHPLELEVVKEDEKEIVEGKLRCPKCQIDYPIEDGIPNMLPPERK